MSDDKPSELVKAVAEVVKAVPVYQDALQPAAKQIGKGLILCRFQRIAEVARPPAGLSPSRMTLNGSGDPDSSITLSARARIDGGMVRSRDLDRLPFKRLLGRILQRHKTALPIRALATAAKFGRTLCSCSARVSQHS